MAGSLLPLVYSLAVVVGALLKSPNPGAENAEL